MSCILTNYYKKGINGLKAVEKKAGAAFCYGAKKFVPMGADAMAKEFDCKAATKCLQEEIPIVNKCFNKPETMALKYEMAPRGADIMAIAGAMCVPAVYVLASFGSKFVAEKCDCDEQKLKDKILQLQAACGALGK